MYRVLGFCMVPIGGLILLFALSDFSGLVANIFAYGSYREDIVSILVRDGLTILLAIALFGFGVRWLKGEIGIVFLSLGGLAFMATVLPIIVELMGFSTFSTPYSIGKFIGNVIVFVFAIILFSTGISSFSSPKDKTIIDDV